MTIISKKLLKEEYINKRKSIRGIAQEQSVCKTTILNYLNKFNIKSRTPSEAILGNLNHYKGKSIHSSGYILIYAPNHPNKDCHNYVAEHRLVIEKHLGRYLTFEEVVHHKNGIKADNKMTNLMLFPNRKTHQRYHQMMYLFLNEMGLTEDYTVWVTATLLKRK